MDSQTEYPIICPNCEDKFGNCWYGPIEPPSQVNLGCNTCDHTGYTENPQRCKSFVLDETEIHVDKRGTISKLMSCPNFKTFLKITTKKDEIRGNHFHRGDAHACYVSEGSIKYYEQLLNDPIIHSFTLKRGQIVFTPPMIIHAFKSLEDSAMFTYSTEPERNHESYETDTTRVKLI